MKLKAFSIIEMIVALTIASSVISLTYYALTSIRKVIDSRQIQISKNVAIHELRFLMQLDFNKGYNWILASDGNSISSANMLIQYRLLENKIIRENNNTDQVFKFKKLIFETTNSVENNIITNLKITIRQDEKSYTLNFPLNQNASYLVNESLNSGN